MASIKSQWPVRTQIQTTVIDIVKLKSSAAVNRPQQPSDIRWPSVHGRMIYWHIGRSRKASATVAMTETKTFVNRLILIYWKTKTHSLCKRQRAFAWNRRRKTWQEVRWKRPTAGKARVWCPMSRNQNLCQGNLLRTIKAFKDTSYLYRDTPARPSANCSSFHSVASSPFHVPPAPCLSFENFHKRWARSKSGMLRYATRKVQLPS